MPGNSRYVTSLMASDSLASSYSRTPLISLLYTAPPPSTLHIWFQHPRVVYTLVPLPSTPARHPRHPLLPRSHHRAKSHAQARCPASSDLDTYASMRAGAGGVEQWGGCRRCMQGGAADAVRRGRWGIEPVPVVQTHFLNVLSHMNSFPYRNLSYITI